MAQHQYTKSFSNQNYFTLLILLPESNTLIRNPQVDMPNKNDLQLHVIGRLNPKKRPKSGSYALYGNLRKKAKIKTPYKWLATTDKYPTQWLLMTTGLPFIKQQAFRCANGLGQPQAQRAVGWHLAVFKCLFFSRIS